jgi:gliding motility-associated-like protein
MLSQIDTAFWFAAPWVTPGHANNVPIVLRLSSFNQLTQVRVRQPAGTFDTTFSIPANSLISESLSHLINQIENIPANTVLNRGLKISSDFPITAIYEVVTNVNNPETYSLKGQNGMGKEFVCPFQTKGDNGPYTPTPKSQIDIIATENGTVVWITPKCNVVGHSANVTYSITLNQGQSYCIENVTNLESVAGQNLSGTIVVSNKAISVTVSDDSVHGVSGCYDLMGDQIVPVEVIGTEYIINKGGLNAGEYEGAYIVATQNFTQLTINDGGVTNVLLNRGDTYFYLATQPLTYIVGDKPVYVIHASGFGCELGEAIIPPLNCAGSDQVSFTRTNTQTFILNILCKTIATGNFSLNGNTTLVPASGFTIVPGTGGVWSGFQKSFTTTEIPVGVTNLLANSNTTDSLFSMGVINGGAGSGCLYHYMSSFLRKVFTNAGPDKNLCTATTTISLNGTVDGGAVSGIWTTPNGTGTFGNPVSLNTTYTFSPTDLNLSQIKFILSSTGNCTPIRDTMLVNLYKSPTVDAGNGSVVCKNNISPIGLAGTYQHAFGSAWTTSGSGSFGNIGAINTTYIPSPSDLTLDSVKIKLTTIGNLNACPDRYDSLYIKFTPAPVVSIGPDLYPCASNPTVAITGTVSGGSSTGIWTGTGTGLFSPSTTSLNTIYQLSASDVTQGSIIIKLTSTNNGNCKSVYDSLIITVTPPPAVNAGANDTICSSNVFYPINGSVVGGANTGSWTTLGNGTFGNANNLNTIYTLGQADTLAGQVKLVLTSTGSNCPPKTDTLLITIAKSPIVNSGPDNVVCDNQKILLNGNVVGLTTSGAWTTFGTGVFTPNDSLLMTYYQPSAIDIANGFVKLLLSSTYNKGCAAISDTIKLTFKPAPNADFTANNECAKKPALFTDNSTTTTGTITAWSWNFGDAGTSVLINPTHSYVNPGTYSVTHVVSGSNGCKDTIVKPIDIYFLPQALFYQNTPCVGNITQFVDSSKTLSGNLVSWNWNFGDIGTSTIQNPAHAYSQAQTFTVSLIVTSSFGCKDTIKKAVTVIPGPLGDFSINPNPLEALETASFTDLTTGPSALTNWFWNFGDSTATNIQNPQHSYNGQGDYSVILVVKDINGCIDTVRKDVSVILLPDVPTAFTPNGDGQNDVFLVRGGPFKTMNLRIYNNWGQFIFESSDQLEGWNGTYNGTEQPIGVFVWVVEVEMLNGKKIKKTGDVTLIR